MRRRSFRFWKVPPLRQTRSRPMVRQVWTMTPARVLWKRAAMVGLDARDAAMAASGG
jgi:hypothetical protein